METMEIRNFKNAKQLIENSSRIFIMLKVVSSLLPKGEGERKNA